MTGSTGAGPASLPGGGGGRAEAASLDPVALPALSCAAEIAARRIARHLAAKLPGPLEKQGLLAVVTASGVGAAVLAAARQLGNLHFPVSGIILGSLEYSPELLQEEIKRCRAFRIPLRECQNAKDLDFVLRFPGLRLIAVDLQEEVTRHSELRDGLLEHPCVDLWSIHDTVSDEGQPWYRQQHWTGWESEPRTANDPANSAEFQPLITVSDLGAPTAPSMGSISPLPENPPTARVPEATAPPGGPVTSPAPPAVGGRAAPKSLIGDLTIDGYLAQAWAPLTRFFAPTPVTREICRLLDSRAIREFKMTGLRMMELAAFQAAEIAALMARPFVLSSDHRVAVVCGLGNNGGDGYVVARYLACWGFPVDVYVVGDRTRVLDDALINLNRLERLRETFEMARASQAASAEPEWRKAGMGDLITPGWTRTGPTLAFAPLPGVEYDLDLVPIASAADLAANVVALQHAALIVDGLLGTGMHGEVRGINRDAIAWINAAVPPRAPGPSGSPPPPPGESEPHVPVLALDIPSGIDASTGAVLGAAVQADVTVTFGAPKIGLSAKAANPEGPRHAGRVILAEISWPPSGNRGW